MKNQNQTKHEKTFKHTKKPGSKAPGSGKAGSHGGPGGPGQKSAPRVANRESAEELKAGDRIVVTGKRLGSNGEGGGYYRRKAGF
ncbi:23S rRNA (uracil(1939)-C(5))-methyltransferase RlmD, partial [Clostridium perfringens]